MKSFSWEIMCHVSSFIACSIYVTNRRLFIIEVNEVFCFCFSSMLAFQSNISFK